MVGPDPCWFCAHYHDEDVECEAHIYDGSTHGDICMCTWGRDHEPPEWKQKKEAL